MSLWLREIWRAWRASLRRPGFLLLASGVLALGVGATSAIFSMVDGVLLQPLPYAQPQQLVALGKLEAGEVQSASPQQYQHLAGLGGIRSLGIFESAAPRVNIAGDGLPVLVASLYLDHQLLPTLGVQPLLGRNFSAEEDRPHGPPAVILSHGLWQSRYGSAVDVIGRRLQVEGVPHTIVGVLPASFTLSEAQVLLPAAFAANAQDDGTNYTVVARLADGMTPASLTPRVNTQLHALYADSGEQGYWSRQHFGAQDLRAAQHADSRAMLVMWMGCALAVLLIALVNLTNLMLLRTLSRQHEAAVRGALGASPWRQVLPALAEGLLVAIGGVSIGQSLSAAGLLALRRWMPVDWMPVEWIVQGGPALSLRAWALAVLIGLFGAALAAGLGLWRGRRGGSMDELREGGRSGLSVRSGRLGRVLVVAQMALATTLLVAAGMFLHTLYDASRVNLGFDPRGVLTFELAPLKAIYPDAVSVQQLSEHLLQRLRMLPGVDDATATTNLPAGDFSGQFNLGGFHLVGAPSLDDALQFRGIGTNYFQLFGIAMRQGRGFASSDVRGGEQVAIVNQKMADTYYGGHALGQLIQRGEGKGMLSARIVGVVADTYQYGPLDADSIQPIFYMPLSQMPDDALQVFRSFEPMRFALKVNGRPDGYRKSIIQAVSEVATDQPIANVRTMQSVVDNDTLSDTFFNLVLVGLFAALALLLASIGMYAVMAVAVAAREREFGVRSALGAPPARLMALVLRNGLAQVALGLAAGIVLGFASSGVLRTMISALGRSVFDPLAIIAVCAVLTVAGTLACLPPAWRAGRIAPMRALRGE